MSPRRGIYIVPTNRWYIERTVWLIAGGVLLARYRPGGHVASAVGAGGGGHRRRVHRRGAFTGFCPVGNVLARLGFAPMLARPGWTPGRWYFMQTDRWYLERRIYLAVGINVEPGVGPCRCCTARGGWPSPASSAAPWSGSR